MARTLRPLDVYPITVRPLHVVRTADVTPGMRRVTLGGEGLKAHTAPNGMPVAAFRSEGFDDEFKVILKHPDAAEAVVPEQADGILDWPRTDDHLLHRTYTVRRWDPEAGEIDVDFVVHGVGPATSWARRVQPGDEVHVAGPKMSGGHPRGVDWTLVLGDETALPSIGRWLEQWPAGARGQVFIEVADDAHRQDLPVPDGVELTWLSRDGAEPGTTTLLFDAVQAADWWDGKVFAWAAGEALTLAPIRRWLRREKGLRPDQLDVTGYWRRQEVVASADDPQVQDLTATEELGEKLHEMTELLPGLTLRLAVGLDLVGVFGDSILSVTEAAAATGTDPVGMGKLLRYLTAIEVAEMPTPGHFALTTLGKLLDDERLAEHLDLGGAPAQRELAGLVALPEALRSASTTAGSRWAAKVAADKHLARSQEEADTRLTTFIASALTNSSKIPGTGKLAILGNAPGVLAESLTRANAELEVAVVGPPSQLAALQELHGEIERVAWEPGGPLAAPARNVDAVLFHEVLRTLPDLDAIHALAQAGLALPEEGRLFVLGEVLDPALATDHDYEADLLDYALTGGGARTDVELRGLFRQAGFAVADRNTVGWGVTLYTLARA